MKWMNLASMMHLTMVLTRIVGLLPQFVLELMDHLILLPTIVREPDALLASNNKDDGTADIGCTDPDKPLCRDAAGNNPTLGTAGDRCVECSITSAVSVCVAIDESTSVNSTNFDAEKTFAKQFIERFAADASQSEFGVVSFSSSASIDQNLTNSTNAIDAVDNLTQFGGSTDIVGAIRECTTVLSTAQYAPVLALFTDGGGDVPADAGANATKANGTTIICLGIGNEVDVDNLRTLATDPDNNSTTDNSLYAVANDFSDLDEAKVQELLSIIRDASICQG
jgi:uncharacterized protein YegL